MPPVPSALDLLDARFKTISSLKEIIVDVQVYDEGGLSGSWKNMHGRGWTVNVTKAKLPGPRTCISYDGIGFGLKCKQQLLLDRQKEEEWCDEYYRRRNYPYRRNDSDYD